MAGSEWPVIKERKEERKKEARRQGRKQALTSFCVVRCSVAHSVPLCASRTVVYSLSEATHELHGHRFPSRRATDCAPFSGSVLADHESLGRSPALALSSGVLPDCVTALTFQSKHKSARWLPDCAGNWMLLGSSLNPLDWALWLHDVPCMIPHRDSSNPDD